MSLMTTAEFERFFETYARNVDRFSEASYWKLSNEIIRRLILRHLKVGRLDVVLDAGGGTGRWAIWLASTLGCRVCVADLSVAMLAQAAINIQEAEADLVSLVRCDLQHASELPAATHAGVISIYNMLSFVDDARAILTTMYRTLRSGGVALVMGQGLANALSSKLSRDLAAPDELRFLADTQVVKWKPHVPRLRVYASDELAQLGGRVGFEVEAIYGITCLVVPGPEDFVYPYERMSAVSRALDDPDWFAQALELEMLHNGRPGWTDRGVNLMAVFRRP